MFTLRFQTKKGDTYVTVKTIVVNEFNEALAIKAEEKADSAKLLLSMLIGHDDPIPDGFNSKKLEFNTSIWRSRAIGTLEAMDALDELELLPF